MESSLADNESRTKELQDQLTSKTLDDLRYYQWLTNNIKVKSNHNFESKKYGYDFYTKSFELNIWNPDDDSTFNLMVSPSAAIEPN